MPLAFATILAGSITLIGTSTNLVVNGVMQQYGLPAMGMFELAPVGIPDHDPRAALHDDDRRRIIPDRFRPEENQRLGGSERARLSSEVWCSRRAR
jgi:hypothetical protein